jgi:hypothetical protein
MTEHNTSLMQSIFFLKCVINFCLLSSSEEIPFTMEFFLHIGTWSLTYLFCSFNILIIFLFIIIAQLAS